jgi:hypothetical protein
MSCCNEKRLDGLQTSGGADLSADVEIGGDLTVKGGEVIVDPAEDGWGHVRSSDDAFGLDIEAPAGKRIRLLNGGKSWVEVDDKGLELNAALSGQVGLRAPNVATNYEFTLPIDMGAPTQVLTSDGTNTYWSTPAGPGGGGTVTSVDLQSLTSFLTTGGGPITGAGIFGIDLSGVPLDVLHGGTGVTTSTGTGSVVLNTDPDFSGSLEAVTDKTPSGDSPWKFINLTPDDVVGIDFAIYRPNVPDGGTLMLVVGKTQTEGLGVRYVQPGKIEMLLLGQNPSVVIGNPGVSSSNGDSGTFVVKGGMGVNVNLHVTRNINVGGDVNILGQNSGRVDVRAMPDAGTWDFNLPLSAGNVGQVLVSQGGGLNVPMTWEDRGSVTSVNVVAPSFLNVTGGPITSSGTITLSYSGVPIPVGAGGTGATTSTGTGSVVLNTDPVLRHSIGLIDESEAGTVTIRARNVTGTYDFNLPLNAGIAGQVLTSQGGGGNLMTWTTVNAGTVTSVGLNVPSFLSVSPSVIITSGIFDVTYSGVPLPVVNGGTGVTTSTGTGSVVLSNGPSFENWIKIDGVTIQELSGNYNFNLPIDAGSAGQFLTSQGGSGNAMTWTTISGTGTVTSVGMTVPSFLSILGSPITTSGTLSVGYSGVPLPVLNGGTGVTSSTGTGSVVLNTNPVFRDTIGISGTTSGTVTIKAQAAAGTWNLNLPTTAGTAGQALISQGGGSNVMTWGGGGTVTSVGISSSNSFISASGTVTTSGNLSVGLSGGLLPISYGGTGTTSTTGTGAVVFNSSPSITSPSFQGTPQFVGTPNFQSGMSVSGTISGGRLNCSATSSHQISVSSTNDIAYFNKTDMGNGGRGYLFVGQSASNNLSGALAFNRNDGGNGSRLELVIFGQSTGVAVYRAFLTSTSTWSSSTLVVDGGGGFSADVYTQGSVSLLNGNFRIDTPNGGKGGLETHEGNVFRYTKGSGNMELECAGHTISNLLSSMKWSRMGNMVYVYFDATFDISDGSESELVWTNLPAIPLGTACAPMSLQTDLQPGAIFITKKYVVEVDPVMGARFYRVGADVNNYQKYVIAETNVRISGMLTYPADETF